MDRCSIWLLPRVRRPDLIDLGHILLRLCLPTPALIILSLIIILLRLIFDVVRNFWQGLNFVVWCTHNTWYSRRWTRLGNTDFEWFISESTWLEQKTCTWFSKVLSHLLKGDFASETVLSISLHLLKLRSIWQSSLHVWKNIWHQLWKRMGSVCFLCQKQFPPFHEGGDTREGWQDFAQSQRLKQKELLNMGFLDPRLPMGYVYRSFVLSKALPPGTRFTPAVLFPACTVLSWTPYPIPSLRSASVFWGD